MSGKKKIVIAVLITAVVTAFLSCGITLFATKISVYFPTADEDKAFINKMQYIDNILSKKYLYDYDKADLREKAIQSYVEELGEPYTHYYTPAEFSSYMDNIQDGYVGIGIIVGVNENNQIEVVAPFEGSPAFEAGIVPGDVLKAVEGVDYAGDKLTEAVDMIKNGKEGTTVNITILRNGSEEINLTVERRDISSDSVKAQMLDDNIGYIRVSAFNMESQNGEHSTSTEFEKCYNELTENGMEKLIIDLRDNPGGVLTEACTMADKFIPEGVITYTEDKNGERKDYNSKEGCVDIPVVILINENSASASEVFTGALKDYGKATVVGEKSYGKGIVQDVYTLYDGSGISFTSARYFTPNGTCIHEIGIEPDVVVEMPEEYKNVYASMVERDKDAQLQKAIEIIMGK